jgi:cell division septal protein FtsQ
VCGSRKILIFLFVVILGCVGLTGILSVLLSCVSKSKVEGDERSVKSEVDRRL